MHARGAAAAVILGLLVACGCVDASTAPSGTGQNSATPAALATIDAAGRSPGSAAPSAGPPSPGAVPVGSGSPELALTIDPTLEASLPERIGTMRFARHSLTPGGLPPPGFSDDVGRALLRAGSPGGALSVAWSEPVTADVGSPYGVSFLAIRIPGVVAHDLREVLAIQWILVPGFAGSTALDDYGSGTMLGVGNRAIGASRDTLYVLTFPADAPQASAAPGPTPAPPFMSDEVFAALPPIDPEPRSTPPTRKPVPSIAPGSSPPPAPDTERLLPDRIRGASVAKISGQGLGLFSPDRVYLVLPAYALYQELPLDIAAVSAAGGHPEGLSTFWIVATRIPGVDAQTLLTAWLRPRLLDGFDLETIEVAGHRATVYGNQAVTATDGVLYWMTYLDIGDFPPASPAPRPPIRDVVIDTLRALP